MFIGAWDILEVIDDITMTFTSGYFLVFFAIIILMYYMVAAKDRWIILLIGSLLFGAGGGIQVILYPFVMTTIVYNAAILIENTDETQKRSRRLFLTAIILILSAVLALVKCDVKFDLKFINIAYPIGISYYTFSMISYLVDVYWRNDQAEHNLFRLLLYIIYFPKIMQGPITRHKELAKQLAGRHHFSYQNFCFGLQRMIWGFFKKLVIAERAGVVALQVFGNYEDYGGCILFIGIMLETVQLYCDFSGYMDIAIGISQTFGITLDENFNHPFFSKSAEEFWRRWHITLGVWFKDYVYMPIAFVISPKLIKLSAWMKKHVGKQAGKAVIAVIPLTAVWLLTGLWHGTGFNYIVWGMYWGSIILFANLCSGKIRQLTDWLHINTQSSSWKMFQMVRTFLLFCFGQLITVPGDLEISFEILKKFVLDPRVWELVDGTLYALGLDRINFQLMLVCIGILWIVSIVQEKCRIRERVASWNFVFRCLFYCLAIWSVMVFGMYGPNYDANAFLYMNF